MQRRNSLMLVAGICLTVVVSGIAGILWFASNITGEAPDPPLAEVTQISVPTPAPTPSPLRPAGNPLPMIPDADELLRSLATDLSAHPKLAAWLLNDRLVRRFVASVIAIAGGYSPRDELDFLQPIRPFIVLDDESSGLVIAPGSYQRYDTAAEVFTSLDTRGLIQLFHELKPAIDRAHSDLSWGDVDFEGRLREAVDHLLDVSVPSGQLAVERRVLTYSFADDRLEHLSDAQRQLLRMGPHNARRVQAKLHELWTAFGWTEPPTSAIAAPAVTGATEAPPPELPLVAEALDQRGESRPPVGAAPVPDLSDATVWADGESVQRVASPPPGPKASEAVASSR